MNCLEYWIFRNLRPYLSGRYFYESHLRLHNRPSHHRGHYQALEPLRDSDVLRTLRVKEDMTWLLTLKLKVLVCHPDPSPRVFTSTPPPLYHLHTSIPTQFSTLSFSIYCGNRGPKILTNLYLPSLGSKYCIMMRKRVFGTCSERNNLIWFEVAFLNS